MKLNNIQYLKNIHITTVPVFSISYNLIPNFQILNFNFNFLHIHNIKNNCTLINQKNLWRKVPQIFFWHEPHLNFFFFWDSKCETWRFGWKKKCNKRNFDLSVQTKYRNSHRERIKLSVSRHSLFSRRYFVMTSWKDIFISFHQFLYVLTLQQEVKDHFEYF